MIEKALCICINKIEEVYFNIFNTGSIFQVEHNISDIILVLVKWNLALILFNIYFFTPELSRRAPVYHGGEEICEQTLSEMLL